MAIGLPIIVVVLIIVIIVAIVLYKKKKKPVQDLLSTNSDSSLKSHPEGYPLEEKTGAGTEVSPTRESVGYPPSEQQQQQSPLFQQGNSDNAPQKEEYPLNQPAAEQQEAPATDILSKPLSSPSVDEGVIATSAGPAATDLEVVDPAAVDILSAGGNATVYGISE